MSSPPSAGPSTARRLTLRQASSQVGPALSQDNEGDNRRHEQAGQGVFEGFFPPPVLDDPDDLSYEDTSDGGAPSPSLSDHEERGDTKGKEKAHEEDNGSNLEEVRDNGENGGGYESFSDEERPGDEERPNRFRGRSATWMGWTRRERQEISALEKTRARDLSLHLFNIFALKKRAKRIAASRGHSAAATPATEGFGEGPNGGNAASPFAPTKHWSAWPMPAEIVPRGDESRFRDEIDLGTMRMDPDVRPSAELEECIMAQMLQTAKERFNAREWDSARVESCRRWAQTSTGPVSGGEDQDGGDGKESGKEQPGFESAGDGNFEEGFHLAPFLKPVALADDEKARGVLRPATRRVLTQFDELLMGLHHARQAYVTAGGRSQGDPETEVESPARGSSTRRKRRRASSPHGATSAHEKMHLDEEEPQNDDPPSMPTSSASNSPRNAKSRKGTVKGRSGPGLNKETQTKSQAHRQEILGLRDWSDVLGVASMTGWAQPAVMRAARRCADLFDEDMIFRTMDEGRVHLDQTADGGPTWRYTEHEDEQQQEDSGKRPAPDKATVPKYIGKLKEYAKFCPVSECPRHMKGFSRTWNLNEHLRIKHPELARERTQAKVENDTEAVG